MTSATPLAPTPTIFERLGGSDGIAGLVDDIVDAHMQNPTIRARFLPIKEDPQRLATTKQHLCHFIAAGTGGPAQYAGRSMPEAHRGMNVSAQEYMAAVDDIMAVLGRHGIDEATQNDVLAIAYRLKADIVGL